MEVKHIGMAAAVQTTAAEAKKVTQEKTASDERKDKLQLSGEAKELMESKKNARIELMKARVESGYYLSDEVTEKTAEKILKAL